MLTTLGSLAVLGVLGAIDTLYFHEYRGRLPAQHGGIDTELKLHAGRDAVYVIVFGTLPWVVWSGGFGVVLILLLVVEIVITMTDFVVEDRVRAPLGGVRPGERVLHGLMAIVYGGMAISFAPVVVGWIHAPTRLRAATASGHLWLNLLLASMAVGIAVSGVRDCLATSGRGFASWPWRIDLEIDSITDAPMSSAAGQCNAPDHLSGAIGGPAPLDPARS